jgi:hypothetical protein
MKTIDELRNSEYHAALAQKLFAAFLAQQQGISLNAAFNKIPGPVSDLWLIVAEAAREAYNADVAVFSKSGAQGRVNRFKM